MFNEFQQELTNEPDPRAAAEEDQKEEDEALQEEKEADAEIAD